MENWKVITWNENYEVSDLGRVRNAKTKRILSTKPTKSHRHPQVFLYGKCFKEQLTLSHIVYDHFVRKDGKVPTRALYGVVVTHKDGNILNNRYDNLECPFHNKK